MSGSNTNSQAPSIKLKKKAVSFTTQEVFDVGFKPDVETAFCSVSKMLFRNVINVDGSIDMEQLMNLRKRELWYYIYYLYQYNNGTLPEFISMKNPKTGKADGLLFYQVVYSDALHQNGTKNYRNDIGRLVYFINYIVHTYKTDLVNPIIDYLRQLMKTKMIAKLSEVKVQMAPLSSNGNAKNVRIGFEVSN